MTPGGVRDFMIPLFFFLGLFGCLGLVKAWAVWDAGKPDWATATALVMAVYYATLVFLWGYFRRLFRPLEIEAEYQALRWAKVDGRLVQVDILPPLPGSKT